MKKLNQLKNPGPIQGFCYISGIEFFEYVSAVVVDGVFGEEEKIGHFLAFEALGEQG
jgi:hypothetical protein